MAKQGQISLMRAKGSSLPAPAAFGNSYCYPSSLCLARTGSAF